MPIVSLPHKLQSYIFPLLDQYAIHSCILVCKSWSRLFYPELYKNIRIGVAGYNSFLLEGTIKHLIQYSNDIHSLNASHPSFISTLLDSFELAGSSKPYFPNLKTLVISFSDDIKRSLRDPVVQPQFFYPSDYDDSDSDDSVSDVEMEIDSHDPIDSNYPIQGKYRELYKRLGVFAGTECLAHNPFNVVDLVRQCPNLADLTLNVKAVGQLEGLNHLLWPGVIPQSIERIEIYTPLPWLETKDDDSQDEDYDPNLYSMRDVDEEFEEDDDEFWNEEKRIKGDGANEKSQTKDKEEKEKEKRKRTAEEEEEDGYNEDELVQWYRDNLVIPRAPPLWQEGFPQWYGDGPKVQLSKLRELVIHNTEDVRNVVWWFIEYFCPKLTTFHMINPTDHFCENFSHRRRMNPEFKNLIIDLRDFREDDDYWYYSSEEGMACALGGSNWETVSIKGCFSFSLYMISLLAANQNLREIDVNVAGGLSSVTLQCILRHLPNLRVLKGRSLYFFARTFGQIPWACIDKLQVFQCQILFEIPRADRSIEQPNINYWSEEMMNLDPWGINVGEIDPDPIPVDSLSGVDASYEELQLRAMSNLGRCHNLQELDLSHWAPGNNEIRGPYGVVRVAANLLTSDDSIYSDPSNMTPIRRNVVTPWKLKSQKKCLDFTLENGLEKLSGLRSLRQLNLERLRHRISVRELEWMRDAWPDLEDIKGLFWDPTNDDENEGNAKNKKYLVEDIEVVETIEERNTRESEMKLWLFEGLENKNNTTFWRTSKR